MESLTDKKLDKRTGDGRILFISLSFLLPFLIIVVALIFLGIIPFGEHSLALGDGKVYVREFSMFTRLLHGEGNFLYSFENGLGGNEWSLLAWGGLTPVTLLTFFATPETMPVFFTWITVTDICICGVTMYFLLADVKGHKLSNLIFSTSYALMGFTVAYCYHFLFFAIGYFLHLLLNNRKNRTGDGSLCGKGSARSSSVLSFLGRNSLWIYIFHPYVTAAVKMFATGVVMVYNFISRKMTLEKKEEN